MKNLDYERMEAAFTGIAKAGITAAEAVKAFGNAAGQNIECVAEARAVKDRCRVFGPPSSSVWRRVSKRRARKLNKRGEFVVYGEDGSCSWLMIKDLHKLRAAEMFGVSYPSVTMAQRTAAKSAYFFVNYD